ncbi:MAG: DUF1828 domain-containing protein [Pseudomonadota bacterium]|nr:DUF1828 domain-containing protein [Pseudomonadota bacterium]
MKEQLCQEFCERLRIRETPAGLSVGTGFAGLDGDPIGFYVIGPDENNRFRIEDNGATVPVLEACGADLDIAKRAEIFRGLLEQYGVHYDERSFELKTTAMSYEEIPKAALRFVALMLRLQDLTFLSRENAESSICRG